MWEKEGGGKRKVVGKAVAGKVVGVVVWNWVGNGEDGLWAPNAGVAHKPRWVVSGLPVLEVGRWRQRHSVTGDLCYLPCASLSHYHVMLMSSG